MNERKAEKMGEKKRKEERREREDKGVGF